MNSVLNVIWIIILAQAFFPLLQKRMLQLRRQMAMRVLRGKGTP